jgi:hypothetical protein
VRYGDDMDIAEAIAEADRIIQEHQQEQLHAAREEWQQQQRAHQEEQHRAAHLEHFNQMAEHYEDHKERVEEFRDLLGKERYDLTMAKAATMGMSPMVEDLTLSSPKSAHLQFYLASNPQVLDKLNHMSGRAALQEVRQIESHLILPQPRLRSSAPPPPRTPKGGAAPPSQQTELDAYIRRTYGHRDR